MKKAIIAVSFGTSYPDTLEKTIAATERALAVSFSGWEVRRAFTSGRIIEKLCARDGVLIDNVTEALQRLLDEGYEVTALDNLFTGTKRNIECLLENRRFSFVLHDVTQP